MLQLIPLLMPAVTEVLDRLIPDKAEAAKVKLEMEAKIIEAVASQNIAQMEINKEEAKNSNIFISGWRPFIGWVCGSAFAYHFLLQPFMVFLCATFGYKVDLPVFDMDALNTVLMGMLGLGGLRSFDKFKGTAK